jgi:hypothetical protein
MTTVAQLHRQRTARRATADAGRGREGRMPPASPPAAQRKPSAPYRPMSQAVPPSRNPDRNAPTISNPDSAVFGNTVGSTP